MAQLYEEFFTGNEVKSYFSSLWVLKTLIMPQVAQARTMTLREFSACKNEYIAQWANCKDLNGKEQSQPKARSE